MGKYLSASALWALITLPALGMNVHETGEAVAAWLSAVSVVGSACVWLGLQVRSWKKATAQIAAERQAQVDAERAERQQIMDQLRAGSERFDHITQSLEALARGRRINRRGIERLVTRIEAIEARCDERHKKWQEGG